MIQWSVCVRERERERKREQQWGWFLFRFPLRVWERESERAFPVPFSEKSSALMSSRWILQKRRWKFEVGKAASHAAVPDVWSAPGQESKRGGKSDVVSAAFRQGQSLWSAGINPTGIQRPSGTQAEDPALTQQSSWNNTLQAFHNVWLTIADVTNRHLLKEYSQLCVRVHHSWMG